MKNSFIIILLFILTGCGFSSGLYKDILLAQDYIEKRDFKKAASIYQSILLKKPSLNIRIKVNDQLGEIYSVYLSDYQKSIKHFQNIVEESNVPKQQVRALEKIGDIYFDNLKDFQQAQIIYKKLTDFFPPLKNRDQYYFRYSLSLFNLNRFNKAKEALMNIINSSNEGEEKLLSYYYLGLSHFYLKQWSEANEYWFEYLKRETRKDRIVQTKFLIANAYESSEKLKEAYNIYYSILGEYPNSDVINNRLKSLYERRVSRKR